MNSENTSFIELSSARFNSSEDNYKRFPRRLAVETAPNSDNNSVNNNNKDIKKNNVNENKVSIKSTGNGLAGLFLLFFTIYMVYFMIHFLRDIFVSHQLVREPLFLGKIDQ